MKKQILLAAVAAVFAGSALAQEGGRITRVMLYPGAATIERAAQVVPGQARVTLTGLPANFDPRTLRVEADPGIRIGEIAVRDVARVESLAGRESQLEAKIQALKDEKSALDVEVKTAELVRDYLVSLNARQEGERDAIATLDHIVAGVGDVDIGAVDGYSARFAEPLVAVFELVGTRSEGRAR